MAPPEKKLLEVLRGQLQPFGIQLSSRTINESAVHFFTNEKNPLELVPIQFGQTLLHGLADADPQENWVKSKKRLGGLISALTAELGDTPETKLNLEFLTSQLQTTILRSLAEKQRAEVNRTPEHSEDLASLEKNIITFFEQLLEGTGIRLQTVDILGDPKMVNETTLTELPEKAFLFVDETGNIVLTDMQGFKPKKDASGPLSTNPMMDAAVYQNISGFIIVPTTMPLKRRKDDSRYVNSQVKRFSHEPRSNILTVDENLFNNWQEAGMPWAEGSSVQDFFSKVSSKKRIDYGAVLTEKPQPTIVTFYEPDQTHIGGNQLKVIVRKTNDVYFSVGLDLGWIFNQVPAWSGMGKTPSYYDGIAPFLKQGMFDTGFPDLRLYRSDLLLNSIRPGLIQTANRELITHLDNKHFPVSLFVCLEVLHRFGLEYLNYYLRQKYPVFYREFELSGQMNQFWKDLAAREQQVYSKKVIHSVLALTHAHQDHAIGSSFVRDSIMRMWTPHTRALLLNDHFTSSNWYVQDTAVRKLRERPELKSSGALATFAYPHYLTHDGERIEVAPDIFLTAIGVEHSVPGTAGYLVEIMHRGQLVNSVAYAGDYKDNRFFEEIGKRGGADLLIIEGTNPPKTKKDFTTETKVTENFARLLGEAGQAEPTLIIVDLIKNALVRLNSFLIETVKSGRTPVISPRIALTLHHLQQHLNLDQAHDDSLPKLSDFPSIKIWKKPAGSYKKFEQELFSVFGQVTQDELSADPNQYVLIRDSSESILKLEGIAAPSVIWVQSTYAAYDQVARIEKKYRRNFAAAHGWKILESGFHASGHVRLLKPDHPGAEQGILASLHKAKAKEIVVIHTEYRGTINDLIRQYHENDGTEIHERLRHPNGRIVLEPRKTHAGH